VITLLLGSIYWLITLLSGSFIALRRKLEVPRPFGCGRPYYEERQLGAIYKHQKEIEHKEEAAKEEPTKRRILIRSNSIMS
jgi:hypothetical protein